MYSYLFLCPATAVYLFKKYSITLTVALHFPFYLKGRPCYSHTAKNNIGPAASTSTDCEEGRCKVWATVFTTH